MSIQTTLLPKIHFSTVKSKKREQLQLQAIPLESSVFGIQISLSLSVSAFPISTERDKCQKSTFHGCAF